MVCGMITIIWVTYVQKHFQIQISMNMKKQLLTEYQIFKKFPKISHIHKNRNFLSIILTFYTNCFFPINFMAELI